MTMQKQEVALTEFNFTPTTLKEAQEYATIFANSGLCPQAYKGRPNDILIVWQMGDELGLKKMQALRTLGCINGMPFAYGDGLLALVKRHKDFLDMKEWDEGDLATGTLTAYCTIRRKNEEPKTQKFSIEDAKRAGLWNKSGPWTQYPKRMLQHRARSFAARDAFPDALYGLMTEEEVKSIPTSSKASTIKGKGMQGLEESLGIQEEETVIEGEIITPEAYSQPSKLDELKELLEVRKVKQNSIKLALEKFGVKEIDELTDEMIEKWSIHLKSKESK